jgi:hypothetical protein
MRSALSVMRGSSSVNPSIRPAISAWIPASKARDELRSRTAARRPQQRAHLVDGDDRQRTGHADDRFHALLPAIQLRQRRRRETGPGTSRAATPARNVTTKDRCSGTIITTPVTRRQSQRPKGSCLLARGLHQLPEGHHVLPRAAAGEGEPPVTARRITAASQRAVDVARRGRPGTGTLHCTAGVPDRIVRR